MLHYGTLSIVWYILSTRERQSQYSLSQFDCVQQKTWKQIKPRWPEPIRLLNSDLTQLHCNPTNSHAQRSDYSQLSHSHAKEVEK